MCTQAHIHRQNINTHKNNFILKFCLLNNAKLYYVAGLLNIVLFSLPSQRFLIFKNWYQSVDSSSVLFCFSRQGFSLQSWLSWSWLCRPAGLKLMRSACLCWDWRHAPPFLYPLEALPRQVSILEAESKLYFFSKKIICFWIPAPPQKQNNKSFK